MSYGICLGCGKEVEKEDVDGSVYPGIHKGCGGEAAVHIDIRKYLPDSDEPHPGPVEPRPAWVATVEDVQIINTLYGGPFHNEGVECDCGERTKRSPCVHCGRPVDIEYVKPKPPRFCEGPSYVWTPADRLWEENEEENG